MNTQNLNIIYQALDNVIKQPALNKMCIYSIDEQNPIKLKFNINKHSYLYSIECRSELRANQVANIVMRAAAQNELKCIYICSHIQKEAKEQLVINKIPYIEGNGNIYLPEENSYIWIDTNNNKSNIKTGGNRAFTKVGLKVVFHLLMKDELLNMSYRQIADLTGTGLGNVPNVIRGLEDDGFLKKKSDNTLQLLNKKALFERWAEAYERVLKPVIKIGTYRFDNELEKNNWRRLPLTFRKTVWGGEAGAHLLTGMLKPSQLTIYSSENRTEVMENYRLVRDEDGYITLYDKFWDLGGSRNSAAPPLLIYAELINSSDPKNHEAAARIFDNDLKSFFD